MTHLSAAAIMIDTFGREGAPSVNPEMDMALRAQTEARSGGLVAWFFWTPIVKALVARKAERDLNRAMIRLAETSPHLLADIGLLDIELVAPKAAVSTGTGTAATGPRAAKVPVALRPAQRPAIAAPQRAPAKGVAKVPVTEASLPQPLAQ
jgi:hypothetical protein